MGFNKKIYMIDEGLARTELLYVRDTPVRATNIPSESKKIERYYMFFPAFEPGRTGFEWTRCYLWMMTETRDTGEVKVSQRILSLKQGELFLHHAGLKMDETWWEQEQLPESNL